MKLHNSIVLYDDSSIIMRLPSESDNIQNNMFLTRDSYNEMIINHCIDAIQKSDYPSEEWPIIDQIIGSLENLKMYGVKMDTAS